VQGREKVLAKVKNKQSSFRAQTVEKIGKKVAGPKGKGWRGVGGRFCGETWRGGGHPR